MLSRLSFKAIKGLSTGSHAPILYSSLSSHCTTAKETLNDINFSSLSVTKTSNPKPKPVFDLSLKFGSQFTDHMLQIDYDEQNGWYHPTIIPYQNFELDPACMVFHYAMEAFEGLKAYKDSNDNIRLFRPEKNVERLLESCKALEMPVFNSSEFLKCLKELIKIEKEWIPKKDDFSLYIRPTIIGTAPFLGVSKSPNVRLYVILSPVGPYYPEGFSAVSLLASDKYARAWPGGSGDKKLGSNYGPTIRAQMEAKKQGFSQVMWLYNDGTNDYVTEVGTMNQFFYWKNENGENELITAPLDGTILPGVTRDSILQLSRQWNEFKVTERPFTMKEVIKALEEKRLLEAFGTGTAAIVSPVKQIGYKDKLYDIPVNPDIPLDPKNAESQIGPLAKRCFNAITDIQYGKVEHPWSVILK